VATIVTTARELGQLSPDSPFTVVHRGWWGSLAVAQPDIDGDGRPDLLWRRTSGGVATIWIWFDRRRSP